MKPYVTPILRDLGRMDAVTRKSGPDTDFASEQGRICRRPPAMVRPLPLAAVVQRHERRRWHIGDRFLLVIRPTRPTVLIPATSDRSKSLRRYAHRI